MSQELSQIIPSPQSEVEDTFSAYQTTHQFYTEVQTRSEFKQYCERYYITAERNRQDLEKMRGELNIMRWFRKTR
ncbi:MAG: hypothetical protein KME49_01510 [Brasilonema octagenarum HA4186-MV1]|jgi:hypothetical protein|uniref:Uncharacterized protein n=2 Tax=Brasilonema TaxID=383614 RepID=A0A856MJP2_9CYAN|nr:MULTISPECIES: hypothetical protein [Brasilonema]MBW4624209.1 hypothetical protein [Brasilonema octagenarum HA4186-MV1]NMF63217.1 hypothetical protein [Brasilonema octagenarum UFV-OR1]QDL09166.1 hypothetical protein DP114_15800 [Brasilonema sennae CENA114]QDL15523.1 hypothetical protein DP113_15735 [Brasilonema octagenarum UFV-E1]